MVRVLLNGYGVEVRSSREVERVCVDVVAFRWSAAQAPDFRSIARFRKRHLSSLGNVFLQALELCRAAGMVSLEQVALDGRKVCANASRGKMMSFARLTEKKKVLADRALHEFCATRGVFITTSAFTPAAISYTADAPSRIILIDGQRLVDWIINYLVGGQLRETYAVVVVDDDFID